MNNNLDILSAETFVSAYYPEVRDELMYILNNKIYNHLYDQEQTNDLQRNINNFISCTSNYISDKLFLALQDWKYTTISILKRRIKNRIPPSKRNIGF